MRFPERDLTDQFISLSYQDVLQQYNTTGSSLYVLDGYGNVVFGIPTASLGYNVITSDITSSMTVLSASYSLLAGDAINATSASYALNYNKIPYKSITGSYSLTNDDYLIYANASSGSIVLTMPDPSLVPEQIFKTKKIDSTGYEVIISSSVNIDYDTELRLSQRGSSVTLHSDSTQYWIH